MAGNKSLNAAAAAKQDEFYTQLSDIEKELRHYRKHFAGKTVLCNCDDPYESNFFKYFVLNFNRLKLKKLIATCYAGSPIVYTQMNFVGDEEEVVEIVREKKPYKVEVTQVYDTTGDGAVDMLDVAELFRMGKNSLELLEGDGDFRSPECLELMDEADIVVTNPPFSLFREYVEILMERKKHFIIIGSENNVTYKEIFPLLRDGNMWLGNCYGDMAFRVPSHYEARETRFWIDESGQKWRSMGNIVWFTNLDIKRRHEPLILFRRYDPERYPHYDNFDAIDVDALEEIPCDYSGIMGVPLTIMHKHDPTQFEIVGFGKGQLAKEIGVTKNYRGRCDIAFTRPDGKHKCPYGRILVRNLHPEEERRP